MDGEGLKWLGADAHPDNVTRWEGRGCTGEELTLLQFFATFRLDQQDSSCDITPK